MSLDTFAVDRAVHTSRNSARAGGVLLAVIAVVAIIGPLAAGEAPTTQHLDRVLLPPGPGGLLGTDYLGRSILSRLAHAIRLSTGLALVSVVCAAVPGTLLGIAAAWRGGWIDRALSLLADAVLALPGLLVILMLLALAPGTIWPFYTGLAVTLWVEYFRVVRASAAVLLASPQVEASRMLGFGTFYITRRHLLPDLLPLILTVMTFGVITAVLTLATAGYVGFGLRPPTAELGLLMSEAFPYFIDAPWLMAAPVVTLVLIVTGLFLVGGRLRAA
jgi:peptide/nickel transport system permease protein